ncbi:ankyrin repeat domain-containing protein 2-like [Corticium candelabrum]|uniref:ankyrin repeat domain-containing protein 2-like n=1 Tax=Corticium candelabrum TaxID=121492 RepID=UPI002E2674B9|nr:ankyrin repeat domain-containing protein 2-like [Corticium candelabrum]
MAESQSSRAIDDELFDAVVENNVVKASEAIAKSADVNVITRNEFGGWYGTGLHGFPSALQVACGVGSIQLFDLLIRKEANVKYQEERYGYTALHYASDGGHVSIMKRLISCGCNKQVKAKIGCTALHVAGNVDVVDYLLIIGLNIEDRDKDGYTPFLCACRYGRLPVVQRLIESNVCSLKDVSLDAVNCETRMKPKKAVVNAGQYINLSLRHS